MKRQDVMKGLEARISDTTDELARQVMTNALNYMRHSGLTFNELRKANKERALQYRNGQGVLVNDQNWTQTDWSNAMAGEFGELLIEIGNFLKLCDSVKKMRRGDEFNMIIERIKKELGDNQTYLDLLADRFGINLGEATRNKFNEVSNRVGADVYL